MGDNHANRRRLIVNADDFGRSSEINEAVVRAHSEGILTTASLMVNGSHADEAIKLARKHPSLGVGLHLVLVCGRSTLKPTEIPGLVDHHYHFSNSPFRAGLRYFFRPSLRSAMRNEIYAQIRRFQASGLKLDHLNGHLNIHLHPSVFNLCLKAAHEFGVKAIRHTHDPFLLDLKLSGGNWLYRVSHAFIFAGLSALARPRLRRRGIRFTRHTFGLLQNARVDESYVSRLLPMLPVGDSELYSHPSLTHFRHELEALTSPKIRDIIRRENIYLIRYQDLCH